MKKDFHDNGRYEWFSKELCAFYKRPRVMIGRGEEEHLVSEVSRRPDVKSEFSEIKKYRHEIGEQYFPQSIRVLCRDWDTTLDKARNHSPAPKTSKEMSISERAIDAMARAEGIL